MGRKKGDDDEYSIGTELSEDVPKEKVAPQKKGKKGGSEKAELRDEDEVVDNEVECIKEEVVEKEAKEEGPLESTASKKKKKKKEKEKEKKKKAAASTSEETKTEINRKKVPKHLREIQVMLAKLKEAEEEKKRKEEERMRTEEEERRRQEELDRLDRLAVEKKLKENEEAALLEARLCRMGGIREKYDRKSDPNGPREDLMDYAQLAIAAYNKTNTEQQESQWYNVVDIIQSGKTPAFAGYNVHIEFTAKLCNQDDDDAIIFTARLYEKLDVTDIRPKIGDAPLFH